MASQIRFLLVTLALYLQTGSCLEIQSLELKGGREEYIEVGSRARYILSCTYRSGYDDPVSMVTWFFYGNPVYRWTVENNDITVSGVLSGKVDASPDSDHGSLHFTNLDYYLAGNYTCKVSSKQQTVQASYVLHVVDISPLPFDTSVHILKDLEESENEDDNKYITYDLDSMPTDAPEVDFEDNQCTLVWNFESPAIFPKPNVTCGYYSFIHEDVVQYLPAGLTMHKFMNGSWQASFAATRVQVSNIPVNHRLGCSIKIPETTYSEIIRSKDDFSVDHLIDSAGCPGLEDVAMAKSLLMEHRDSSMNCRGNLMPDTRDSPAIVKLSCPYGSNAIFPDGKRESDWWMELSCMEYDSLWKSYQEGMPEGELIDVEELPECDMSIGAANAFSSNIVTCLVALLSLLLVHYH